MGLDMYLHRVPKVTSIEELEEMNDRLDEAAANNTLMTELTEIQKEKSYIYSIDFSLNQYVDIEKWKENKEEWGHIISLTMRVGYWRKFNALHNWFVDNVQDGVDECEQHIVTREHLVELQKTVDRVLSNRSKAAELFPTGAGFFFGGTEYDEYYWEDMKQLQHTVGYLLTAEFYDCTYVYCSSW